MPRNKKRVISSIIALFSLVFSSASFAQTTIKTAFKDWQVNCDQYNTCIASTSSDLKNSYTLSFTRGKYQGSWEISLIANGADPKQNQVIKVDIEGNEISFLANKEFAAYGSLNQYYFLGEKAQKLFDALTPANEAKISFIDLDSNSQTVGFSLNGMSASLLFIDDKHNRVGSKHNAGDPPSYKTLVTSREPDPFPDMLKREHEKPTISGCEPMSELVHGGDLQSYRLDAENTLYLVPCTAGAYNFSYIAYTKDGYETRMQLFASFWEGYGWSGTQYLVNPWFNEKQNILTDFTKGRGLGDCGATGVWQWGGYSFKLLQYTAKSSCDGSFEEMEEIGDFPVIYQDKNYSPPKE